MAKQDFNPVQGRMGNGPGKTHGKTYGVDRLGITSDSTEPASPVPSAQDAAPPNPAPHDPSGPWFAPAPQSDLSAALAATGQASTNPPDQADAASTQSPEPPSRLQAVRLRLAEFAPLLLAYKRAAAAVGTGLTCLLIVVAWWMAHRSGPAPAAAADAPKAAVTLTRHGNAEKITIAPALVSDSPERSGAERETTEVPRAVLSLVPAGESKVQPPPIPGLSILPTQPARAVAAESDQPGAMTAEPNLPMAAVAAESSSHVSSLRAQPARAVARPDNPTPPLPNDAPAVPPAPTAATAAPVPAPATPVSTAPPTAPASQPASQPAYGPATPNEWRDCPAGFCLSGIMRMSDGPVAIINNRSVKAGGVMNGATVVRINEFSAEMELDGKHFMLGITSGQGSQDRTSDRPTKKSGKGKKSASRPAKAAESDSTDEDTTETQDTEF